MAEITGQVFFRETGINSENTHIKSFPVGKRLMMFAGIVAVDNEFPLQGEHKYDLVGYAEKSLSSEFVSLNILKITGQNLPDKGLSINEILLSPIWRV